MKPIIDNMVVKRRSWTITVIVSRSVYEGGNEDSHDDDSSSHGEGTKPDEAVDDDDIDKVFESSCEEAQRLRMTTSCDYMLLLLLHMEWKHA